MTDDNAPDSTEPPPSVVTSARSTEPRKHSGEWVRPPPNKSIAEILELTAYDIRGYFLRHAEDVDAIRCTEEYDQHVERLRARAATLPDGHWASDRPARYVELLSDAYVWSRLVE